MKEKEGVVIWLPLKTQKEVEAYRDKRGLEKTAIAARRLIKLGLEVEAAK
ncbi:MAG: hypothetical protein NTV61_06195 [Candidatus Bathyarchaeota archaeon]|nr:hypothetical protein [Candidatus Bathyarchaeota archaeon]